jgi:hypothetical protein
MAELVFDADGERPVSKGPDMVSKWWIRAGVLISAGSAINQIFTPNRINRVFRKFSAS